jgi:DNA-binding transcriptional MerR regulator
MSDSLVACRMQNGTGRTQEQIRKEYKQRDDREENILLSAEVQCDGLRATALHVDIYFKWLPSLVGISVESSLAGASFFMRMTIYNVTLLCYIRCGERRWRPLDEKLISKKELLRITGISYGQLYRWKRKNLIPEEWFIRKSTYTGQETFFPKQKILDRIDKIKRMKDDLSLDEIARRLSPKLAEMILPVREIIERNIVTKEVWELFRDEWNEVETLHFEQILRLYVVARTLQTGDVSLEEARRIWSLLEAHASHVREQKGEVWVLRKMGIAIALLTDPVQELHAEADAKVVVRLSLAQCAEELKIRMMDGGV